MGNANNGRDEVYFRQGRTPRGRKHSRSIVQEGSDKIRLQCSSEVLSKMYGELRRLPRHKLAHTPMKERSAPEDASDEPVKRSSGTLVRSCNSRECDIEANANDETNSSSGLSNSTSSLQAWDGCTRLQDDIFGCRSPSNSWNASGVEKELCRNQARRGSVGSASIDASEEGDTACLRNVEKDLRTVSLD